MTIKIVQTGPLVPPGVLAAFGGVEGIMDAVIEDILEGARAKWVSLANEQLNSTRQAYINGLQQVKMEPGRGTLTLAGGLPVGIEEGFPEMDMHDTLLGPNVPVAPLGQKGKRPIEGHPGQYYRAIPFRHAGPTARGATGTPMGSSYAQMIGEKAARAMGRDVYKAAKQLSPTTGVPYGPTQWGGRLPAGMAPKLKVAHSTDIYAGMVRMEKTYKTATQSTYMTFRTISDLVPEKWHRRATMGIHLVNPVEKYVEEIAPAAFAAFVEAFR